MVKYRVKLASYKDIKKTYGKHIKNIISFKHFSWSSCLFLNTPPLFLLMYVYLYTHVKVTSFPFLLYALYVFVGNWCNIKQTCGDISTKKTIETKVSDEVVLED